MEKPEYKITYGMPRVLYQVLIAYDSSYTSIVYIYVYIKYYCAYLLRAVKMPILAHLQLFYKYLYF